MTGVPHPEIPDWLGEAASVMRTDPPFVTWTAAAEPAPVITHQRELMREGDEWVGDYNYVHYRFADGVTARHYLGERTVALMLPAVPAVADPAAVPPATLAWLQQRFDAVHMLTRDGFRQIWPDAAA